MTAAVPVVQAAERSGHLPDDVDVVLADLPSTGEAACLSTELTEGTN